jgi:HK97 family phage portal protein
MSIFDRVFHRTQRSFFPEIQSGNQNFTVSLYTTETNPTVNICVNKIANTLAQTKLSLYARKTGGGRTPAVFHSLFGVIKKPAIEETPTLFYSTLLKQLLLKGNAYVYLARNEEGVIVSFSLVNPDQVTIYRDSTFRKYYSIDGKNYSEKNILHIPYPNSYNGTKGISPVVTSKELIDLDNELLTYIKKYFQNSLGSRMALEMGETYNGAREELDKVYAKITPILNKYVIGANNAGKVMIPPPDMKFSKIEQTSNVEGELKSMLEQVERLIAQSFSVPYDLITGENKYNSLELRQANFLSECIAPLGNHICESFAQLLDPKDSNLYFAYDYKTLLLTDTKTTVETLTKEIGWGLISINEARAKLEMDSIGEAGDYQFFGAGYVPVTVDNINAFFAQSKIALQQAGTPTTEHNPAGDDKN